jgi:hypothetical protein
MLTDASEAKITDLDILRYAGNMADNSGANLKKREVMFTRQHFIHVFIS